MSNSELTVHGKLVRDVEVTFGKSGKAFTNNAIAYNDRKQNSEGKWEDGQATFVNFIAFGQTAEAMVEAGLQRGDSIIASGELKQENWETKEGEKRTGYKLYVEDIGKSLKWLPKDKRNKTGSKLPADYDDSSVPF